VKKKKTGRSEAALASRLPAPVRQPGPRTGIHQDPGNYVLRLFVAGATARSRQAILRVRQLCKRELKNHCVLEVIDIYQLPHLARANQIVATPTLIKEFPRPLRRFIGNLLYTDGLFSELELSTKGKAAL
jgi:circadian clock protein KaiB